MHRLRDGREDRAAELVPQLLQDASVRAMIIRFGPRRAGDM
jgi:hypothetical protein